MLRKPPRRSIMTGLAMWLITARLARQAAAQTRVKVAALFPGRVDDGGFMQAGYDGLLAAKAQFGVDIDYLDGIPPQRAALEAALRRLADTAPHLVVAHGGQNSEAIRAVAPEFPSIRFIVTQGNVAGPNIGSIEVLQEQSAWLAGALAGLITRTNVVGHMSGIRVAPGLKGRAAYADGLRATNPSARFLTNFSGDQDDNALSRRVATGMADAGADVLFTMLNAGRVGAIDVCRARNIAQIGNVKDWVAAVPDVFIASAVADSGLAVFAAVEDALTQRPGAGEMRHIGLERPEAVRLVMSAQVPPTIRHTIGDFATAMATGRLTPTVEWSGAEFATPI